MSRWVDSLVRDVQIGARSLWQSPSFALPILVSLGLGIGANTAMFSLLHAILLESLPVRDPQKLVTLEEGPWTHPIWEHIREHQRALDGILAWSGASLNLARGGEARFARGILASGSYFEVLGVSAVLGRTFTAEEDRRGCGGESPPAVVSHGFWRAHYDQNPQVLGESLFLDGHVFTIIGVLPPRFSGLDVGENFDVIVPLCAEALLRGTESALDNRGFWWLNIMGRLKPGSSLSQAEAALRVFQSSVREATMPADVDPLYLQDPFVLVPAGSGVSFLRRRYTEPLLVLMGVVGLVLLVACANIAHLVLARAGARAKEFSVRASLGASRSALLRQLLTESLLLAFAGAALGAPIAWWGANLLVRLLSTERSAIYLDLSIHPTVLGFTAGMSVVAAILFGVYPALRVSIRAPVDALPELSRGVRRSASEAARGRWLLVLQVGISLVLVFGAGLFLETYGRLARLDPGFDPNDVWVVTADVRKASGGEKETLRIHCRILDAFRSLPGVQAAAASAVTPISGENWRRAIEVDGLGPAGANQATVFVNYVSSDYFEAQATPILAGRDIEDGDRRDSPRVALVNESMAERYFEDDALGRTFRVREGPGAEEVLVVGVVRDAKYSSLRAPPPPTAYLPLSQLARVFTTLPFSVRARGDLASLRAEIVRAVAEVDRDVSLSFRTLESQLDDALVQERLMATLSALFGALALILAAVGIAGLVSHSVSRRRSEIAIRSALGASPGSVVRLVLREVMVLTVLGVAAGVALSLLSGRFVGSLLYGLDASDPSRLALAASFLLLLAATSGYFPARGAARIDPVGCLRSE